MKNPGAGPGFEVAIPAQRGLKQTAVLLNRAVKIKRWPLDCRAAIRRFIATVRPLYAARVIDVQPSTRAQPCAKIYCHQAGDDERSADPP